MKDDKMKQIIPLFDADPEASSYGFIGIDENNEMFYCTMYFEKLVAYKAPWEKLETKERNYTPQQQRIREMIRNGEEC